MSPENYSEGKLTIRDVKSFVELAVKTESMKCFDIEGKSNGNIAAFSDFVYLSYPNRQDIRSEIDFKHMKYKPIELYDKISTLRPPEGEAEAFQPYKSDDVKYLISRLCSGMPYAVLAFGRDNNTHEELISMFTAIDQSPIKVLRRMQAKIRERRPYMN